MTAQAGWKDYAVIIPYQELLGNYDATGPVIAF